MSIQHVIRMPSRGVQELQEVRNECLMSAFIRSIHAKEHKLLRHAFCIYRTGHTLWWLVEVNKAAMSPESNFHSHDPNQVKNFTKPYIYHLPSCTAVHGIFDIVCCSQNKVAVEGQLFASPLWIRYLDRSRIFSLKVTVFFLLLTCKSTHLL